MLASIGVVAGAGAKFAANWTLERDNELILSKLTPIADSFNPARIDSSPPATGLAQYQAIGDIPQFLPGPTDTHANDLPNGISLTSIQLASPAGTANETLFESIPGRSLGIDPPYSFEIDSALLMHFRSISSGDIHGDGWPDLVVSDSSGLYLYANQGGSRFQRQTLSLSSLENTYVTNAVLVDINNDRQLDLFIATFDKGNYIALNDGGDFDESRLRHLPNLPGALRTVTSAFGDIDRDGDLDIVLGNWSVGHVARKLSLPSSRNAWLRQDEGQFVVVPLPATPGETFSTLLTDVNGDSILDLFVGNDFVVPDAFYIGKPGGGFEPMTTTRHPNLRSTQTSMSIASSDVNNDLRPEIYVSQVSELPNSAPKLSRIGPAHCEQLPEGSDRDTCVKIQSVLSP